MRWLTLALVFAVAGCGGHADARLDLSPPMPASEPAQIGIDGLAAGRRVSVEAHWRAADGRVWTGARTVRADNDGHATVGTDMLAFLHPSSPGGFQFMLPELDRNRGRQRLRPAGGSPARRARPSRARDRMLRSARAPA